MEALQEVAAEARDGVELLVRFHPLGNGRSWLTDVRLPGGVNERHVVNAARDLCPNLPVLLSPGYADNAAPSPDHLEPGMAVVTEPFDMTRPASRIRQTCETRQG